MGRVDTGRFDARGYCRRLDVFGYAWKRRDNPADAESLLDMAKTIENSDEETLTASRKPRARYIRRP